MLKQNGVLLAQMPMRHFGGAIAGETRTMWRNSRSMFVGGINQKGGYPNGHLAPSAWLLPQKAGSMSASTSTVGIGTTTAAGAMGITTTVTLYGVGDTAATGGLITSGTGTASGTGTTTGNILAALYATVSLTGVGDTTGALLARGLMSASAAGVGGSAAASYAVGYMSGSTSTGGPTLTAVEVATEVWNTILLSGASANATLSSIGGDTAPTAAENASAVWAKVLASGSTADATVSTTKTETTAIIATQDEHTAGLDAIRADIAAIPPAPNPPTTVDIAAAVMGATIEGTYALDETLRLVAAVLVGTVTGAGSGVETFMGLDLVTPRVVSTVDASGNRTSVVLDGAG